MTWPILGRWSVHCHPLLAWPVMIHHSPAPIARFQISRSVLCPVFANQQRIRWLAGDGDGYGYERHRGRKKKRWFYSVIRRIQATMSIDICTYYTTLEQASEVPIYQSTFFFRVNPQHTPSKLIPNYISARGLYISTTAQSEKDPKPVLIDSTY